MSDTSSLPLAAVMRAQFPSLSHGTFRTLNGERCIRVNDHVAADGWTPVSPGDVISILSKDGGLVATFRARGGLHAPDATPEKSACQPDAVRGVLFRAVSDALGCSNGEARRYVRSNNVCVNGQIEHDEIRAIISGDNIKITSIKHGIQSVKVMICGRVFPSCDGAGS